MHYGHWAFSSEQIGPEEALIMKELDEEEALYDSIQADVYHTQGQHSAWDNPMEINYYSFYEINKLIRKELGSYTDKHPQNYTPYIWYWETTDFYGRISKSLILSFNRPENSRAYFTLEVKADAENKYGNHFFETIEKWVISSKGHIAQFVTEAIELYEKS